MKFTLKAQDGLARAGEIQTAHSLIQTPVFMPVGTVASVKSLHSDDLLGMGAQIILANTYHLYLRPGQELVKNFGGLHGFTRFNKSFLTDSGGFQAFSLGAKPNDDGVSFASHIDGSKHFFSPQKVIDIQHSLGSDIMMVLDDLSALPATKNRLMQALKRTSKWAEQSLRHHLQSSSKQALFAIVQGGIDLSLRSQSADELTEIFIENKTFDGFAIGGLSVGEEKQAMYDTISHTAALLPKDKPRYLMGVGTPMDLITGIDNGIDMFDCVMPTRNARNGTLFVSFGRLNIKNAKHLSSQDSLDPSCDCYTCKNVSLGYLAHLFRSKELSYYRLASIHNVHYYLSLMREARKAIIDGRWNEFKTDFKAKTQ